MLTKMRLFVLSLHGLNMPSVINFFFYLFFLRVAANFQASTGSYYPFQTAALCAGFPLSQTTTCAHD